jgi:hypothetical protein
MPALELMVLIIPKSERTGHLYGCANHVFFNSIVVAMGFLIETNINV